MAKQIKHILVIRLSAMGDVAMTVPVLRAFTRAYPAVKITVLTKAFFTPIFADIPNVSCYVVDTKQKHQGVLGLYHLFKELRVLDIDAVADLHHVLRSNILRLFFILKGTPFAQLDKDRAAKKALVQPVAKVFKPLRAMVDRHVLVFKQLGFSFSLDTPVFPEKKALPEKVFSVLTKSHTYIGIAPFAAYAFKMYPLDKTKAVIARLATQYPEATIVLFGGGEKEKQLLDPIAACFSNVVSIVRVFDFTTELTIIRNLSVMIAMDSGNSHLSAMYGVPTITLWGVTHPYAGFTPFVQPKENQFLTDREKYPAIPTSIYGNKAPESYANCMASIKVDAIVSRVTAILSQV